MTPAIGTHTGQGLLLVAIPGDKGQFRLAGKTTRSIKIARIDFGDSDGICKINLKCASCTIACIVQSVAKEEAYPQSVTLFLGCGARRCGSNLDVYSMW